MLILLNGVQCNIQLHRCTSNADCIELSIHMKRIYMETYFLVDPAHIHHTLDQCYGLCVNCDICGSKLYVPINCNKVFDLVHKHDVICQSDVLVAV